MPKVMLHNKYQPIKESWRQKFHFFTVHHLLAQSHGAAGGQGFSAIRWPTCM